MRSEFKEILAYLISKTTFLGVFRAVFLLAVDRLVLLTFDRVVFDEGLVFLLLVFAMLKSITHFFEIVCSRWKGFYSNYYR